ncbi:MAG: hypothetical protein AAGC77_05150 [Pseudomonadota bacterium]
MKDKSSKSRFKPSKAFLKYLTLVQSVQAASSASERATCNAEREKVTLQIARRRSKSIGDIFEKMYVWRMEIYDPEGEGEMCYDDMFPLSVYFDLKALANFDGASPSADKRQEKRLRSSEKDAPSDENGDLQEVLLQFPHSVKIH